LCQGCICVTAIQHAAGQRIILVNAHTPCQPSLLAGPDVDNGTINEMMTMISGLLNLQSFIYQHYFIDHIASAVPQ
jgi:hypothetical protein